MSYPALPNYGSPQYGTESGYCPPPPAYQTDPCYCPAPPPAVVCQTIGDCPSCRQGFLTSNITCLGVCCAIFLFPVGLICLFLLQEERCSHCGYCTS